MTASRRAVGLRSVLAALAALCLLTQAAPSSTAGFTAQITGSNTIAGTAQFFTCDAVVAANKPGEDFAYRLGEANGAAVDASTWNDSGTYKGTTTRSPDTTTPKACPRDAGSSYALNGTSDGLTSRQSTVRDTFSAELWFRTATAGGKLIGLEESPGSGSGPSDRLLYLASTGSVVFGVAPGDVKKTIVSPLRYDDGIWHQAIATLSAAGMVLYLDGRSVASYTAKTTGQIYPSNNGYWKVGYGSLTDWLPASTTTFFKGSIRFATVYTTALTATQVRDHYGAGK
jgi:hypothetical protein